MYNKITLVGRISTDLELKMTSSNKVYCKFNLAVNRNFTNQDGEKETDFIPVRVWNKQAENLVQYQNKGSLILVEGSLNVSNYTDAEGNNKRVYEVMAQNIQFLGSKREGHTSDEVEVNNIPEVSTGSISLDDLDLPFDFEE